MVEFPINWQLKSSGYIHEKKNCLSSKFKINAEWSLTCLWTIFGFPDTIEIQRNSTAEEILISGTFNLICGQISILQQQFTNLIEVGISSTEIRLENNRSYFVYPSYCLQGTLKVPVAMKSLMDLSRDLDRLLDPHLTFLSDVVLKSGTDSFSVHKIILSARSPVFAAMFNTEMKENVSNIVDIVDISTNVLKIMLTYIYTGLTGELCAQLAGELLFAADKYQLLGLRTICIDCLKGCISAENVLEILVLGHLHDSDLKVFAMDFLHTNLQEFEVLEETKEWKNLIEKKPALAMEILTHLVKSKYSQSKVCTSNENFSIPNKTF